MDALRSTLSREEGNDFFRSACLPGIPKPVRGLRFQKALVKYVTAKGQAAYAGQRASASKNIGAAHWKLAELAVPGDPSADPGYSRQRRSFIDHAADAEINLELALSDGQSTGKSNEWIMGVRSQVEMVRAISKATLVDEDRESSLHEEELGYFVRVLRRMGDSQVKACVHVMTGVAFFKKGVVMYSSNNDFKSCLSAMHDSKPMLDEARRLMGRQENDGELKTRIDGYLEQVDMQLSICESRQAVAEGDRLLPTILKDQEQPDIDMLWTVADFYKRGVLLAGEKCLESEALAHSRMGILYHKVLKMRLLAKRSFMRSLALAESMHPKDLSGEEWHKEASIGKKTIERLDEIQNNQQQKDKSVLKEELKSILDPMTDIVEKTEVKITAIRHFLSYVYKHHPPKLADHVIGSLKAEDLKRTTLKAIQHYHGDRQQRFRPKPHGANADTDSSASNAAGGSSENKEGQEVDWGVVGSFEKWEVLCGEICRHLNSFYNKVYKGG